MDRMGIDLLSLRTEEEDRLWEEAVTPLWRVQDDTRTGLQRLLELARRIPARSAADERQALADAITALARGGLMRVETIRQRLEEAAQRGDTTALVAELKTVITALAGQQAAQAVGEVGQAFDQAAQAVGGHLERLEQAAAPPPVAAEPVAAVPPQDEGLPAWLRTQHAQAPATPPAEAQAEPPQAATEAETPAPPPPPLTEEEETQIRRWRRQVADLERPWWRRGRTWAGFGLVGVIAALAGLFIAGWWAAGVGALLATAWSLVLRTAALERAEHAEGLEEAIEELLHPRPAAPAAPQPPVAAEPAVIVRRRPAPQGDGGA